jgi:hypothetical protein
MQTLKFNIERFRYAFVITLLCLFLLTGCIFRRLAFSNANFLLVSELDSAFNLTSAQEDFVEEGLDQLLSEINKNEVIKLRQLLKDASEQFPKKTTSQQVAIFFDRWANIQATAVRRASLPAGEFLMQLNSEQIKYFHEFTEKRNREKLDTIADGEAKFSEKRFKKVSQTFTQWLGSLNSKQENAISEFSKSEFSRFVEEQPAAQRSKSAFLKILSAQPGKIQLAEFLIGQQSSPFKNLDTIHLRIKTERKNAWINLITQVIAASTPTQTEHFKLETESLALDLLLIGADERAE